MSEAVWTRPYRVPLRERVKAMPWHSVSEGPGSLLGVSLPHWDYSTSIAVSRTVEVDLDGIRADCDVATSSGLRLVATWQSSGTSLCGIGDFRDFDRTTGHHAVTLSVDVAGFLLAADVQLKTQLILLRLPRNPGLLSVRMPGSILWEDVHRVQIEGIAGRFPVELTDFEKTGVLPAGACWHLEWDPEDLEQQVLAGPRLLVNKAHPQAFKAVTSTAPDPGDAAIRSAMYFDVGRRLIIGVLKQREFVERAAAYPDGSVGRTVWRLIAAVFPGDRAAGLSQALSETPDDFETLLQDRLKLFHA